MEDQYGAAAKWSGVGKACAGEWGKAPNVQDAWLLHLQGEEVIDMTLLNFPARLLYQLPDR